MDKHDFPDSSKFKATGYISDWRCIIDVLSCHIHNNLKIFVWNIILTSPIQGQTTFYVTEYTSRVNYRNKDIIKGVFKGGGGGSAVSPPPRNFQIFFERVKEKK